MCCFANIEYFVIFKEDIARSIIFSCSTEFFDLIRDFGGMVVVWNASIILQLVKLETWPTCLPTTLHIGVSEWGWYSTPLAAYLIGSFILWHYWPVIRAPPPYVQCVYVHSYNSRRHNQSIYFPYSAFASTWGCPYQFPQIAYGLCYHRIKKSRAQISYCASFEPWNYASVLVATVDLDISFGARIVRAETNLGRVSDITCWQIQQAPPEHLYHLSLNVVGKRVGYASQRATSVLHIKWAFFRPRYLNIKVLGASII